MNQSDKKTKILRVVTQAEVVVWHLKNFIDRSAPDYDVYIAGDGVSKYADLYPAVTFINVRVTRKISLLHDIKAFFHISYICLKLRPQIIHSIMPKAGLIAAFAGFLTFVPVRLHTFTGQIWYKSKGISKSIYILIDKLIILLNTICLTDSPSQSGFLADQGISQNGKQLQCIGEGSLSGVDLLRFNIDLVAEIKDSFRQTLGIDKNDFVFVFLARKSITKGIKELFGAFDKIRDIPNVKLLFIGPDESDGFLDQLYHQYSYLKDRIVSLDKVDAHEKYIAVSDVLCLPSSSEGFGTIVIEAAALEVPTIGFDIVGLVDSIDNGHTGILVEPANVVKFAEAMRYLYDNQLELNEMKTKARERILKSFSADVIYKLQKQLYDQLILSAR